MILTSGDGVASLQKVEVNSEKNFDTDIVIGFFATVVPSGEFEMISKVMAFKGRDTISIPLNSGKLKY
jgi:hypothetical protein